MTAVLLALGSAALLDRFEDPGRRLSHRDRIRVVDRELDAGGVAVESAFDQPQPALKPA